MSSPEPERIALTVDVEDWIQSTLDFDAPVTERARDHTLRLLDLFDELGARGTWFVQGLIAERFPDLVAQIAARGHEVGSHAYSHRPLWPMSDGDLRAELERGRKLVEDAGGVSVRGFRAPDFSIAPPAAHLATIDRRVLAAIAAAGFAYDSSIVPARTRRYGIADAPRGPFRLREGLLEFPLSSLALFGRWPALGGGYLRMLPWTYHQLALRQARAENRVPVVYLHPYELDVDELADIARQRPIPRRLRWSQGGGRHRTAERLRRLVTSRRCVTLGAEGERSYAG